MAGIPVVAQAGRYHLYEGKALSLVTYPIRVFGALGAKAVICECNTLGPTLCDAPDARADPSLTQTVTNAAGGLNPDFAVPTICVLHDHIAIPALAGLNPLVGPNDDSVGPRFPPMSNGMSGEAEI